MHLSEVCSCRREHKQSDAAAGPIVRTRQNLFMGFLLGGKRPLTERKTAQIKESVRT